MAAAKIKPLFGCFLPLTSVGIAGVLLRTQQKVAVS